LFENVEIRIHGTIIFPADFYLCETRSPTSREQCRLKVSEKRVLRRIFEPKSDDRMLDKSDDTMLDKSDNRMRSFVTCTLQVEYEW
jgi:hypothetical protein